MILNISKEFSKDIGGSSIKNGNFSAEEFYNSLLKERFTKSIITKDRLIIDMNGTNGYSSSFINTMCDFLLKDFNKKDVCSIIFLSSDVPKYAKKAYDIINSQNN